MSNQVIDKYGKYAIERFKIPQRILCSTSNNSQGRPITIWTEMYPSSRAKNGLFVVKNKAAFEKKATGEMVRKTNKPISGWEIKMTNRSRSRGGYETSFWLNCSEFPHQVPADFKNMQDILSTCTITGGVIQDEMIFTSMGLLPAALAHEIQSEAEKIKAAKLSNQEKLKKDKLTKRMLTIGDVVAEYDPGSTGYRTCVYLGELDTDVGTFNMKVNLREADRKQINAVARGYLKEIHSVYYAVMGSGTEEIMPYRRQETYMGIKRRARYIVSHTKASLKLWQLPDGNPLRGKNVLKMMLEEGTNKESILNLFEAFKYPSSTGNQTMNQIKDSSLVGNTKILNLEKTLDEFIEIIKTDKTTQNTGG